MRVFRPTTMAHQFSVVADGSNSFQSIPPASGLHTFPTRIPVHFLDFIGAAATVGACAVRSFNTSDTYDTYLGPALTPGTPAMFFPGNGWFADISAQLEADADRDGFGDETQDQCPTNASTQLPCPATGQRRAALKHCKKKFRHKPAKQRKCKKKAKLLPV